MNFIIRQQLKTTKVERSGYSLGHSALFAPIITLTSDLIPTVVFARVRLRVRFRVRLRVRL